MTNFNKRIKHSASDLDNYCEDLRIKESRNKKNNIENLLLLFLIMFGIVGAWSSFRGAFQPNESQPKIIVENEDVGFPTDKTSDTKNHFVKNVDSKGKSVHIEGLHETYEELTFVIKGYDPNAMYIIDFGDGERREINSKEVIYRYVRAGFYEVSVLLHYKGIEKVLFSDELNIAHAPEIVDF